MRRAGDHLRTGPLDVILTGIPGVNPERQAVRGACLGQPSGRDGSSPCMTMTRAIRQLNQVHGRLGRGWPPQAQNCQKKAEEKTEREKGKYNATINYHHQL